MSDCPRLHKQSETHLICGTQPREGMNSYHEAPRYEEGRRKKEHKVSVVGLKKCNHKGFCTSEVANSLQLRIGLKKYNDKVCCTSKKLASALQLNQNRIRKVHL